MTRFLIVFAWVSIFAACSEEDEQTPIPDTVRILEFNFEQNTEGWVGDFADLPTPESQDLSIFELQAEHSTLPEPLNTSKGALKTQGHNRSDDLFMFWKYKVTGLQANTEYLITFDMSLASQYPTNSAGIGGSPGASVYLKAGAVSFEPLPTESNLDGFPYLRMNIDHGNQSQAGNDMQVLGTIGIEGEDFVYELISRNNETRPFRVRTAEENGELWLIFGTDSGFEGLTTLYYDHLRVVLQPI